MHAESTSWLIFITTADRWIYRAFIVDSRFIIMGDREILYSAEMRKASIVLRIDYRVCRI